MDNITLSYDPQVPVTSQYGPSVSDTQTDNTGSNHLGLAVALGIVGFLLAMIAIGFLFWFCRRKEGKKRPSGALADEEKAQSSREKLNPPLPVALGVTHTESASSSIPVTHEEAATHHETVGDEDPPSNPADAVLGHTPSELPAPSSPTVQPELKDSSPSLHGSISPGVVGLADVANPEPEEKPPVAPKDPTKDPEVVSLETSKPVNEVSSSVHEPVPPAIDDLPAAAHPDPEAEKKANIPPNDLKKDPEVMTPKTSEPAPSPELGIITGPGSSALPNQQCV